jgi:hypothetical protein
MRRGDVVRHLRSVPGTSSALRYRRFALLYRRSALAPSTSPPDRSVRPPGGFGVSRGQRGDQPRGQRGDHGFPGLGAAFDSGPISSTLRRISMLRAAPDRPLHRADRSSQNGPTASMKRCFALHWRISAKHLEGCVTMTSRRPSQRERAGVLGGVVEEGPPVARGPLSRNRTCGPHIRLFGTPVPEVALVIRRRRFRPQLSQRQRELAKRQPHGARSWRFRHRHGATRSPGSWRRLTHRGDETGP